MTEFREEIGRYTSHDNLTIFYRQIRAEPERARLVIAHGLGEHSGRYGNLFKRLIPQGISIWALDHRGHGQSDGRRGHIQHFDQYLSDLGRLIQIVRQDRPDSGPCFLLGHSMGGLIALSFVRQGACPLDGVIASSPALGMVIAVPALQKILVHTMSFVWPGLTMKNHLDATKISHDQAVIDAYENDPRVHHHVSARWFTEFLSAMETVHREASKIEIPLLLQVAGDDYLVNAQSALRFFEKLDLEDKTLRVYEGLYHEIYNESKDQREKVLRDLEDWLESHLWG
ncbi:MAG: lysophospholipase [Desulfobacterales bacterium]|nr:MAG: lysophospholipase [Desulfobacterales bacterium]